MSKDGMRIIVFKLLAYLHDRVKERNGPDRDMLDRTDAIF